MQGRAGRFVEFCSSAIREIGVGATCAWVFSTLQKNAGLPLPRLVRAHPRELAYPVELRAQTSDAFVFRQIMIENEYAPLKHLQPATVIDLGANVGLASAWFLAHFAQARVFAVEADLDNVGACIRNLASYGERANVIHGAAWSETGKLTLHPKSCAADHWVRPRVAGDDDAVEVQGWDMPNLIEQSGFDTVDLLKIDIEGAEEAIFRSDVSAWLPKVRNLCIELHGLARREAFLAALENYNFEHLESGELDICLNLRQKPSVADGAAASDTRG